MLKYALLACLSLFSIQSMASCEDVKAKIDAKLQAKGITSFTLEIVPADKSASAPAAASGVAAAPASGGKIVGNCDNETKNIIYTRH